MKFLDENGLLYFRQKLAALFGGKVDKEQGSGNAGKFLGIDSNGNVAPTAITQSATVTDGQTITGDGGSLNPLAVKLDPASDNALTKSANGIKAAKNLAIYDNTLTGFISSAQAQQLINNAVGDISGLEYLIVASLPQTGAKGILYLVPHGDAGAPDYYDEHIWIGNKYEHIGATRVDLSGYLQSGDITAISNAEIDVILAT